MNLWRRNIQMRVLMLSMHVPGWTRAVCVERRLGWNRRYWSRVLSMTAPTTALRTKLAEALHVDPWRLDCDEIADIVEAPLPAQAWTP